MRQPNTQAWARDASLVLPFGTLLAAAAIALTTISSDACN